MSVHAMILQGDQHDILYKALLLNPFIRVDFALYTLGLNTTHINVAEMYQLAPTRQNTKNNKRKNKQKERDSLDALIWPTVRGQWSTSKARYYVFLFAQETVKTRVSRVRSSLFVNGRWVRLGVPILRMRTWVACLAARWRNPFLSYS